LPQYLNKDGLLILNSSYDWNKTYTEKN